MREDQGTGMDTNILDWFSMVLLLIGALNWGVIGITALAGQRVNVITMLLSLVFLPDVLQTVASMIYLLVGLAGLYFLYTGYKIGRASRRTRRHGVQQTK